LNRMHFSFLYAVMLFLVAMLLDAVYAIYTFSLTKHKTMLAGTMSIFVYLLGAIGVVSYVHQKLYLIPLCLGAFLGTIIVVEYEKRHHIE